MDDNSDCLNRIRRLKRPPFSTQFEACTRKTAVEIKYSRPVTPLASLSPGVQVDRNKINASDLVIYGFYCGLKIINNPEREYKKFYNSQRISKALTTSSKGQISASIDLTRRLISCQLCQQNFLYVCREGCTRRCGAEVSGIVCVKECLHLV